MPTTRQYRMLGIPKGLRICERKRMLRERIRNSQGGICFYCKSILDTCTMDHIIPKSKLKKKFRYARNDLNNLVMACKKCNEAKGSMLINPSTKEGISLPINFNRRFE